MANEQRTAVWVEVGLVERERLDDPKPGTPQRDDDAAQPDTLQAFTRGAHDRDDLLDRGRIRRIAQPLCSGAGALGGSWKWSQATGACRRNPAAVRTA